MTEGQTVHIRFNRQPTTHCSDPLTKYPTSKYSIWLYNNPVRNLDTINFDQSIKIADNIPANANAFDVKIPAKLPNVKNQDVWYLRLSTSLDTAPQVRYTPILLIEEGTYADCALIDAHPVQC